MVTFVRADIVKNKDGVAVNYVEGFCLSTDTKPTVGIANGSNLVEIDTSKVTLFDEENHTWRDL